MDGLIAMTKETYKTGVTGASDIILQFIRYDQKANNKRPTCIYVPSFLHEQFCKESREAKIIQHERIGGVEVKISSDNTISCTHSD